VIGPAEGPSDGPLSLVFFRFPPRVSRAGVGQLSQVVLSQPAARAVLLVSNNPQGLLPTSNEEIGPMTRVICPNCDTWIPRNEVSKGSCETCGKHIPASALTGTASKAGRRGRTNAPPSAVRVGTAVGLLVGSVLFSLAVAGPLHSAGYPIVIAAGTAILMALGALGGALGMAVSRDVS
jgi:hypothetical protein